MQKELSLVGCMEGGRKNLPWEWIEICSSPQEAINLCIRWASVKRTHHQIADELKRSRSHFTSMTNLGENPKHMPVDLIEDLQDLCNNNAINQWQELYRKRLLRCQKDLVSERAELLKTLAMLDRQIEQQT